MGGFFPQDLSSTNQVIGFRNRIINGAMRIDQRNVGGVQTINASGNSAYVIDRFLGYNNLANAITAQQVVLGATSAPPKLPNFSPFNNNNHTHALQWTNSSTATTSTTVNSYIQYGIEANTCVDFGWGNSVPRTVTVSFWVYASVAGIYSFAFFNSTGSAYYVSPYTVTTASTWQFIRIVVPGPTIGTWTNDTSLLCLMVWTLHGSGNTTATTTLNSWTTTNTALATTQTNLGATASSTFAITGAQLELGTLATTFEWRPWETEMRMCQRYFEKSWDYGTAVGTNTNNGIYFGTAWSTGSLTGFAFRVEKRIIPTVVTYAGTTANSVSTATANASTGTVTYQTTSTKTMPYFGVASGVTLTSSAIYFWQFTVNADF